MPLFGNGTARTRRQGPTELRPHEARCSWYRPPIDGAAGDARQWLAPIGFAFDSPEEVDAWHAAGVAAGGTSIEDPPGYRANAFGKLYLAYLRDPDGNKLCGLLPDPADNERWKPSARTRRTAGGSWS